MDDEVLKALHEDLDTCKDYLQQVALAMVKGGVTKYPIFIAHLEELDLGLPIINRVDMDLAWSYSASHLEDFVNKQVILEEKVDAFKETFKNPMQFMCIFIADEAESGFVFVPFDRPKSAPNSKPELN